MPYLVFCLMLALALAPTADAADKAPLIRPAEKALGTPLAPGPSGALEVTADQSLEWYEDKHLYVARGNARAVRGDMTVEADLLTAHEREKPAEGESKPASTGGGNGDIDKMTAEGNVRVTTLTSKITGDRGVYDLNQRVAYVTGSNLKYESESQTVTAKDSMEYWEDKKLAVARGNAKAVGKNRTVEADTLLAQFRDMPNGKTELHTMTATGDVTVLTGKDVSRAEKAVYDSSRNIAILTGNVRITRPDGTQLTGDVGEVDFASNQSRLINQGKGTRVRALLSGKPGAQASAKPLPAAK
ncbi:MAG: LptA/OstA family protein [Bdellovibrionales bacterium]